MFMGDETEPCQCSWSDHGTLFHTDTTLECQFAKMTQIAIIIAPAAASPQRSAM